MKGYVKYIGVIDNTGKRHAVEFFEGLNVVTGRSAVGKSAIIEIFDYCFGKEDNTIPYGIITNCADIYFCVLSLNDSFIVLGRTSNSKKAFIHDESEISDIKKINKEYFSDSYFLTLEDFKSSLNNHFNLKVDDTDTDLEAREHRLFQKKAPCASVRNFVSFMLQHQNLIANKHALFYRFDEKEKREQTIDQFKIFLGFVDQVYYLKKQELAEKERELKSLNLQLEAVKINSNDKVDKINNLLAEYQYLTGEKLIEDNGKIILNDPANFLDRIHSIEIELGDNTEYYLKKYDEYDEMEQNFESVIQDKMLELGKIKSSIKYANKYNESLNTINTKDSAILSVSECPFCRTKNKRILNEANALEDAINWLNEELKKTPVLTETFLVKEKEKNKEINELKSKRDIVLKLKKQMENVNEQIKKRRSLFTQAVAVKVKIESILEDQIYDNNSELLDKIQKCEKRIDDIKEILKTNYNVDRKISSAELDINTIMNQIAKKLDFEEEYKSAKLKFSLSTFDLYFEKENKHIFLRSVGSGANWLACHISLFLALQNYFCKQGNSCLIPPILFLDQPSQVYFPTSLDNSDKFDEKELKRIEKKETDIDADIKAVTNLYQQLFYFCKKTFEETKIMPQIIVTDHADNLKLEGVDFDKDLVRGRRWRGKEDGFIKKV
jgi:hypothetical protein